MEVAEPVEEQGIEKSRLRTGAKRPPAVKAEGSGAQPTLLRPTNFEFAMEVGLAWRNINKLSRSGPFIPVSGQNHKAWNSVTNHLLISMLDDGCHYVTNPIA